MPRLDRYSLAYLPEGPVIDWSTSDLRAWLDPLAAYLRSAGAFGIRMGPRVVTRRDLSTSNSGTTGLTYEAGQVLDVRDKSAGTNRPANLANSNSADWPDRDPSLKTVQ